MIEMKDEDRLERGRELGVDLVALAGRGEHHVQEVGGEGEVVARVDDRQACARGEWSGEI